MSEGENESYWRFGNVTLWGIGASLVVVVLGVALLFVPSCQLGADGVEQCVRKSWQFLNSPPNEIGDTFAGFAGALAFIWIVVTVAMQSQQLKAQREELALTRVEMGEQRKATQDMARSMAAQADIFEDEKRRRDQASNAKHLEELIRTVHQETDVENLNIFSWECGTQEQGSRGEIERLLELGCEVDNKKQGGDKWLIEIKSAISKFLFDLEHIRDEDLVILSKVPVHRIDKILTTARKILASQENLASADIELIRRLEVAGFERALQELRDKKELWLEGCP